MTAIKKTTLKNKRIDDDQIITLFMNYVLNYNQYPKNIFLFCKENEIEESDFYTFFSSFDGLKQEIWLRFFDNAILTMQKEEAYNSYSDKNKLLTLYFTLFEILTLNRTYVMSVLKENQEGIKSLKFLKLFRNRFKDFILSIITTNQFEVKSRTGKLTNPVLAEGAWIQFLFILKFWMEDTSKGFEKTDIVIEKSVNTVVDLLDTKPLENLFDLGKFLWKERRM